MKLYPTEEDATAAATSLATQYGGRAGAPVRASEVRGGVAGDGWCASLIWPSHAHSVPTGVPPELENLCVFEVDDRAL